MDTLVLPRRVRFKRVNISRTCYPDESSLQVWLHHGGMQGQGAL